MTKGRVYLWIQAAVCIALAALFAVGAADICREGSARKAERPMESVYTPQNVAEKAAPVMPLFFAGIGLLIAGLALGVKDENAEKPVRDAELDRDIVAACVAVPSREMLAEQRLQKRLLLGGWGAFALCMTPILIYLLDPAHFPREDLEEMFLGLTRVCVPWTAAGLGALAASSALRGMSALRQAQAARARLREERTQGVAAAPGPADKPRKLGALRAAVIVAAIVLIIAGVLNGSARDVLYKAITICTECVGLG